MRVDAGQNVEVHSYRGHVPRPPIRELALTLGRKYHAARRQIVAIADRSDPAILDKRQELQRHGHGRRDIKRFQRNPSVSEVAVFTFRMYVVPIQDKKGSQRLQACDKTVQIAVED